MDNGTFARALTFFGERLQLVRPDQWDAPTPCADWNVRALVNHVASELLWMPPLLAGGTIAGVGDRFDGDVLGEDPAATVAAATSAALEAVAVDGVRERTVHLSFGDVPGAEYVSQVTSDLTIHGWDLASATGQDDVIAAGLVAEVAAYLGPQVEQWRAAGAFGPAVDTAADASPQDRLLAATGRRPR